jgi:hypothetical protein
MNCWGGMTENSARWIGDFLLLFNNAGALPRARGDAAWATELAAPGCRLLMSSLGEGWRGSPLTWWQENNLKYWLIGELWGERRSSNPADWPGHFALLGHDHETQHWHLWTNRCGTFHVYHTAGASQAALGSYSPAVASVTNKTLDVAGLAGFFSFGFFPADHTYHKEVKIIRPSTHLVLDQSGKIVKQERTWEWSHEPDPDLSFDQAVDQFAGVFHQVIREQMDDRRVAFPISGGLDSRSTIAALSSSPKTEKIWTYSYGYSDDSVETTIARRIAKSRNLRFNAYTIQPYLFEQLQTIMDSVEGFQDITQCRQAYVVDEIANHADYVMAAHWGDVWLDDMGISKHTEMDFLDFTLKKFHKNGDFLNRNIISALSPELDTNDYLREFLTGELEPLAHLADPDFRLKALKTELWSFRWTTASIRMYQPGAFPLLPFYDPRLVDFFCTIPTDYVAGRRLQVEYLKRYAPDLARITWQAYDANLYWYKYYKTLLLPKRLAKKINRSLNNQPLIQRNWEVQFLSPGVREKLEAHLISDNLMILDLVSRIEINYLLQRFYSTPSPDVGYTVSMLLTFSIWLEQNR